MIETRAGELSAWPDCKARRREIERTLRNAGLLQGPRKLVGEPVPAEGNAVARRLRFALEELGPVFSGFGRYLATRVDLFPPAEGWELAALPDRRAALGAAAMLARVERELDRSADQVFTAFEAEPLEARLFFQAHRARLATGEIVLLRIVRPDAAEWIERDVPHLALLAGVFAAAGRSGLPLDEVIAGFRTSLAETLDLQAEADALTLLGAQTGSLGPLRSAAPVPGLTTGGMITVLDPGGVGSEDLAAPGEVGGETAREGARRLCLVWLRLALSGHAFPLEPWGATVRFLPDAGVAFTGGPFTRLPSASREHLWSYLLAAARRTPDEACTYLLREMTLEGPASAEEQLRLRLRQAVPFRDGGWGGDGESLAEDLFLHGRYARRCGYRPSDPWLSLSRGLFAVTVTARRLAPDRDPLRQALEEVEMMTGLGEIAGSLDVRQMGESLERWAVLLAGLPQKLDEALNLAAAGGLRRKLPERREAPELRPAPSSATFFALLLGLASVVLLARLLATNVWGERLGAILFLFFGASLLRLAVRS